MTDNQDIVRKADMALSDLTSSAGKLNPAQADKFMEILIEEAKVMKMATVVPMKSHTQNIDKIRFTGRVLRRAVEGQPLDEARRSKPTLSQVQLSVKEMIAEVRLPYSVLEDSIEQGTFKDTVTRLMAEKISVDMDEYIVEGDTAASDTDLALIDGIYKQATSNVYDHAAARTNTTLWKTMLRKMPTPGLRNKSALRFLTSVKSELDYRDALGGRLTSNLGDNMLVSEAKTAYGGVIVEGVEMFPDDIGTSNGCTTALLLDPTNINVGIWREISVETDKDIRAREWILVTTIRWDVKYAHEPFVVKATNVQTS